MSAVDHARRDLEARLRRWRRYNPRHVGRDVDQVLELLEDLEHEIALVPDHVAGYLLSDVLRCAR